MVRARARWGRLLWLTVSLCCRSVVDVDYSPDSRFVMYGTWSPYVQLCNVFGDYELHEQLDFQ